MKWWFVPKAEQNSLAKNKRISHLEHELSLIKRQISEIEMNYLDGQESFDTLLNDQITALYSQNQLKSQQLMHQIESDILLLKTQLDQEFKATLNNIHKELDTKLESILSIYEEKLSIKH